MRKLRWPKDLENSLLICKREEMGLLLFKRVDSLSSSGERPRFTKDWYALANAVASEGNEMTCKKKHFREMPRRGGGKRSNAGSMIYHRKVKGKLKPSE